MKENQSLDDQAPKTVTTSDEGSMTADDVASHLEGSKKDVPLETLQQLGIAPKPKETGGPDVQEKGGKKGSIFTSPELEYE